MDLSGTDNLSKFIDIVADFTNPNEIQILGESKEIEAIPILFRISDCRYNEYYQVTIRQIR